MAGVTTDTDIVIDRDYSDIYSIKQTAMDKLGPKYFEDVSLSGLNVGELGFVLEQIGNITEDAFNTSAILINESFPNKAIIPESIYSHAANFQLDNTFTSCAKCSFVMLLQQSEILEHGVTIDNRTSFYIDKRTIFSVEDIPFTLDYDIRIDVLRKRLSGSETDYNFSAQYVIDMDNSISDINDPYLKIRKTPNGLVILQFTAHQVERSEIVDNIISNTKINYPVLDFEFSDCLAGFDIFYKSPSSKTYTQLEKRVKFSLPVKRPFCYYKLKNDNTVEITFSSRDGYFQPDFNSEIKIIMYTTKGKAGNFESYSGSNIEIQTNSETYEYNQSITMALKTVSDSQGGNERLSLEALQALTVESYSTANEISTENDIMTYFYNYKYRYGNEILVIKRRDDVTERLFSSFILLKNDDYIYPTNTLHLDITDTEFDSVENNNRYTLQPGHVFVYKDGSIDTLQLIPDVMAYETEKVKELMKENLFVYTNPFLISMTKSPNLVGLYKTIANQTSLLNFMSANSSSFVQFITSKTVLTRGLDSNDVYDLSLSIIPSSTLTDYIKNLNTYTDNDVRIVAGFVGNDSQEVAYMELYPTSIDPDDNTNVTFSTKIKTNDAITSNNQFPILNAYKVNTDMDYPHIPISDVTVNIYILYNDGNATEPNKFAEIFDGIGNYTITNVYSTKNDPLSFIEPMNMMRSTVTFSNIGTIDEPILNANISLLPMVKADIISDVVSFNTFIDRLTSNYNYLEECLPVLRNNTHLDLKFYNTYGKSNNYYIGDNEELVDRVNISISFKVSIIDGADENDVKTNLQTFIKETIENINSSGNNDLYISNLIRQIESNFATIHHLRFLGINDYNTDYQTISIKETDLNNLSKKERRNYVPEMLVVDRDDIKLSIVSN